MPPQTRRLTVAAPPRESVASPEPGKFYTRPWTATGILEALSGGAWFASGRHDFDSPATARLAGLDK